MEKGTGRSFAIHLRDRKDIGRSLHNRNPIKITSQISSTHWQERETPTNLFRGYKHTQKSAHYGDDSWLQKLRVRGRKDIEITMNQFQHRMVNCRLTWIKRELTKNYPKR
jgi:hypothetical protein